MLLQVLYVSNNLYTYVCLYIVYSFTCLNVPRVYKHPHYGHKDARMELFNYY